MIHSSSATIGIVMGLGAAGVLDWTDRRRLLARRRSRHHHHLLDGLAQPVEERQTRGLRAHLVQHHRRLRDVPLFFLSMQVLTWAMGCFGGDPGVPVIVNGKETFPLVPVAVGLYSTFFNVFNTALLFPFVGVFERVLSRVGHTSAEDVEDYSQPRFLDPRLAGDPAQALPAIQQRDQALRRGRGTIPGHRARRRECAGRCRGACRRHRRAQPRNPPYTSVLFAPNLPYAHADLVASLIEEEDFTASLGESLYQVARRVERHPFSAPGKELVNGVIDELDAALKTIIADGTSVKAATNVADRMPKLTALRERVLKLGTELPAEDRGAILAILGSAERAFYLIDRIDEERRSVARVLPAAEAARPGTVREGPGSAAVAPA